jgi:hypothetical protein
MQYFSSPTRASLQGVTRPPPLILSRARLVGRLAGRGRVDGVRASLRPPVAPRASSPSSPDTGTQASIALRPNAESGPEDDDGRLFTVELESRGAARDVAWTLAPLPPPPSSPPAAAAASSHNDGSAAQVLVERVAPGSEAEAAGVRPGDRLRALSDPVRESEMWAVGARPSLPRIRDAVRMRRSATVRLALERPTARRVSSSPPATAPRPSSAAVASSAESTLGSLLGTRDDDDDAAAAGAARRARSPPAAAQQPQRSTPGAAAAMTIGERMAAQQAAAEKASRGLLERQERRREYLGAQGSGGGGGGGGGFLLAAAAAFVLPAALILAVAYSQGLLDPGRFVSPD